MKNKVYFGFVGVGFCLSLGLGLGHVFAHNGVDHGAAKKGASAHSSAAPALEAADQKALQETQDFMKNKSEREAFVNKDGAAKKADDFLKTLVGGDSQLTEETYALAAEVFEMLVRESQGDGKKMQEALERFARDPASFAGKWSPEQQAKLKALAKKIKPASTPQK
jgi:hypothetical protein